MTWLTDKNTHCNKQQAVSDPVEAVVSVPKQHCQNGRADICLAGAKDGICCADFECDIDDKVR